MMHSDTVTRSDAAAAVGSSTWDLEHIAQRLRAHAKPGQSAVLSAWAPLLEAHLVYALADETPAFCWNPAPPAARVVGWGQAALLSADGPSRFIAIEEQAAALWPTLAAPLEIDEQGDLRDDCEALLPARVFGGFAFQPGSTAHPIWTGFRDAQLVLPRLRYTQLGECAQFALTLSAEELRDTARCNEALTHFQRQLAALRALADASDRLPDSGAVKPRSEENEGGNWGRQIESILAAIQAGECSKVVLAQQNHLSFDSPLSAVATLAALQERCAGTATCFAFDFGAGSFVGATPETLVRKRGLQVTSEALAGSANTRDAEGERALLGSSKDLEEHRVVVQAIAETLGPLCDQVEFESEPEVRRLRHLLHLCTPITAELSGTRHVLDLVARLHPTPAVGGAPTHWATRWIAENEPTPRGWYASPVGWFDAEGDGAFEVALRSGVLRGNEAFLYAGAGIVTGSDANNEQAETRLKLQSLWDALRTG